MTPRQLLAYRLPVLFGLGLFGVLLLHGLSWPPWAALLATCSPALLLALHDTRR